MKAGATFQGGFVRLAKPLDLSGLAGEVSGSFAPDSEEEFRLGLQLGLVPGRIDSDSKVGLNTLPMDEFWGGRMASLWMKDQRRLQVVREDLRVRGNAEFQGLERLKCFQGAVEVGGWLNISSCNDFESFGTKLKVGGSLYLCSVSRNFVRFPPRTRAKNVTLNDCPGLTPESLKGLVVEESLNIGNCPGLRGREAAIRANCVVGGRVWV